VRIAAVRERLLGALLFVAVCLDRATLRSRVVGKERKAELAARGRPALHVLWHQRMVPSILAFGYRGAVTMASRSRDGEVIATFLRLYGFEVARGSSSRAGGPALKRMVDLLSGTTRLGALTTDGPRGPARRSKPGLGLLCEALDAPVLPVGASSTRPKFLRSWDRFLVPRPFSACVVVLGAPL
jgi:lysophospholipid acyltransferase (LPLAT)-like uncharacterized protein